MHGISQVDGCSIVLLVLLVLLPWLLLGSVLIDVILVLSVDAIEYVCLWEPCLLRILVFIGIAQLMPLLHVANSVVI
jgi:hypothetical protein